MRQSEKVLLAIILLCHSERSEESTLSNIQTRDSSLHSEWQNDTLIRLAEQPLPYFTTLPVFAKSIILRHNQCFLYICNIFRIIPIIIVMEAHQKILKSINNHRFYIILPIRNVFYDCNFSKSFVIILALSCSSSINS